MALSGFEHNTTCCKVKKYERDLLKNRKRERAKI